MPPTGHRQNRRSDFAEGQAQTIRRNQVRRDREGGCPPASDITSVPLTLADEARLVELETIVEVGLDTFVQVGNALVEINESKLYRATHTTFANYLIDRFGIGRAYAYRMIEAAKVAAIVSPIGDIPNEATARELAGLDDAHALEVYKQAVAETAGRPTAKAVHNARLAIVPKAASKKTRRRSLVDQYGAAVVELDRATRRLTDLHRDDRFAANRQSLAGHHPLIAEIVAHVFAISCGLVDPADDEDDLVEVKDTTQVEVVEDTSLYPDVVVQIVVSLEDRTATVCAREDLVQPVLAQLGLASVRDRYDKRLIFPATRADDVRAALEARGHTVDIQMPGDE